MHFKTRLLFYVAMFSLFASLTSPLNAQWYTNVQFSQNDPFSFDPQRSVLFPDLGLTLDGHPASGKMYAILPAATISKLQLAQQHTLVLKTHILTPAEAASYKKIFADVASSSQIPWIIGAISMFPGDLPVAIGITSTLMDGLNRHFDSKQEVSASQLSVLMSANGEFQYVLVLMQDPADSSHTYVSSNIVYQTKVGSELRSYVITSSTFALKS